ncbi:MAG: glutamate racemase [Ruminococcaceae bacterium]|nr:glutamate racemase [Oscillospiraceae bacterium]
MDNRSIGVFDSGLGGLTAVKQISKELPNENIVYFGDTGRVPYGTRSKETIIKYSKSDVNFLLSRDVKVIVVACGTASSVALPVIKDEYDLPIIGVVDAAANAAVDATVNKKIGIIGTSGTIKSCAYEKVIKNLMPDAVTYQKACPLFVPLVENGHFETQVARLVTEEYLQDIKAEGVDTLILGCTHYPLLKKVIGEYMGENVTLIDAGAEVAKSVKKMFAENEMMIAGCQKGETDFFVSDDIDSFESLGGLFLEKKIDGRVEKIDIERY